MLYAVRTFPLETIDLKYMESGHSFLDVDSMHSTIEHATKHLRIYTTRDWEVAIGCARKQKPPFIVRRIQHSDISDLKQLAASFVTNRNRNTVGEAVNWLRIKWLCFCKNKPYIIQYKYQISDEEFLELNVSSRRGRPSVMLSNVVPAYTQRLPISALKKADLLALLKSKIIPVEHASFYTKLPSSAKARDFLPEPHRDEDVPDE